MSNIYLDNNATTALEPLAKQAMLEVIDLPLNASSVHNLGRKASGILENARSKIMKLAGAADVKVIFTSSGTEANNLAIRGASGYEVLVSAIEHPSALKTAKQLDEFAIVPVNTAGIINTDALVKLLEQSERKCLVSVMLANNETGVIQPLKEVVRIAHRYGALVHTDAAQCFGKIDVNMQDLGVDMMTVSAHKFGGPQGAAALLVKKTVHLAAQTTGGGQEQSYRAGTQNVAAIAGFGVAAEIAMQKPDKDVRKLRDTLEEQIKAFAPDATIFGYKSERLPNTSYIAMPNVGAETQLIHFDINNIAVSAGSACSSGKIEISHVLKAMGVADDLAKTTIRVSFGKDNTEGDVAAFVSAWKQLYEKVNLKKAA
jgi:cysteine desulfurase